MLIDDLHNDLKKAQIEKEAVKVETLRLLLSELIYGRITKGEDLTDSDIINIIVREVKKRKEAAEGFRKGGREDAALKEESEAEVLMAYLPKQLSDEELTAVVEEAINNTGASSISDMGKVIGVVMGKVQGKADGGRVSALVKQKLTG